ncbi:TetR/AcrR family transcriptional regulator [Jidongwangia harbinensis]|uniref:TetR/AcrR family transcriptional regulator n=1 Tax=Jidongwangia harbinensis TaxID=2878561 RepID=UPI001CD9B39B|nr:TetR/AcrR family transcriptional regulator [Jidongwangia harbinensis]MCA2211777.1 TetR/AcrR family transcriptional regulator [Jidongwangia harbinensis]
MTTETGPVPRTPLTRDRVLRAAIAIADGGGLGALTMRRLAEHLGAEAMSLYYHVAGKEELLDGVVDVLVGEINEVTGRIGRPAGGWQPAVRATVLAAREVLLRHPWAPRVLESRTRTSPEVLRYYDALLGMMRAGGFSYDLAHHALHALGSRALGFSQELFDPAAGADQPPDAALADLAAELPHLTGMVREIAHDDPGSTLGWCDDQAEFAFALDLILDGLDRLRAAA